MANPAGESKDEILKLDFDRRLMLQFRGSVVTSDAGLLAYRELDDALGLTAMAGETLADGRTGKNGRHALVGLLRQSVFGRLAGYEDVNDAQRLRHDPAMRWIVGGKAAQVRAASPSQMGRFETQWLAAPENLSALSDLSGQWIDLVHGRRPPRGIVLDMDSSVSPTHGEQEMSVWNGHYACTCYHPLFVFNQFGTLAHLFPGGRGLCNARNLRVPGGGADQIRDPVACQPSLAEQDWLLAQASGRATSERGTSLPCQFQLSSGKLDQAAPGDRQGRVASGRALSARRLHRHQLVAPGRPGCRLLQQARHMRTMDQRGKRRDQWTRLSCRTFAANAVRLQLHALSYNLGNFLRTLATPEPIKDWSLTSLKEKLIKIGAKVVSHGRYVAFQMAEVAIPRQVFQEILRLIAELRPQPPPAPA